MVISGYAPPLGKASIIVNPISITVVVCTANRAQDLAFMLRKFRGVAIPAGVEVGLLIVDNASTDATRAVVDDARGSMHVPVQYVREQAKGSGAARACGLRHATGELIAWTDDDCVVADDWIAKIAGHFAGDDSLKMLGGRIELYDPAHYPITIKTSRIPETMNALSFPGSFLLSCNMVFRRSLASRIGVFDTRFGAGAVLRGGEDADFVYRSYKAGCKIVYAPDVVVYHNHHRVTRQQVLQARRGYSFSDGAFLTKHVIAGDTNALKWFYWRIARLLAGAFRRPISTRSAIMEAGLLMAMLGGSIAFLRTELVSWFSAPLADRRRFSSRQRVHQESSSVRKRRM